MANKNFTNGFDNPRKILRAIYQQYGESIFEDPRQFQALFKDLSKGQFIRELNLIKQSFSENIPSELYKKKSQIPFQILGPQLVTRLHETLGMERGLAEWVVESWAIAFDIIPDNISVTEKKEQKTIQKTPTPKADPQAKKESSLFITSNPPGATVYLGRLKLGVTPITVTVSNADHNFKCKLQGYEDSRKSLSVSKDSTINFNLKRLTDKITVVTEPSGAAVSIDGQERGYSPLTIPDISYGPHQLSCTLADYQATSQQVIIPFDSSLKITLIKGKIPQPTNAPLLIKSNPIGAEIYLDGKKVGITPVDLSKVPFGSHNLLLHLSGYDPVKRTVVIPTERIVSTDLRKTANSGIDSLPQNTPTSRSQKTFGKNKGLLNWALICIGLLVVGLIFLGIIFATHPTPQTASATDKPASVAVIPPAVNQSDTASLQSGISLLNAGNYADALKEFDSAISTNPQSAAAWNYKSFSLFKLGRYNESIQASDKALSIDQNFTAAWINKGSSLILLEQYNEAIAAFDRAIILNPGNADAWLEKGISLYSLQNYTAAIDSLDHVIGSSNEKTAWEYKGKSLQALNKYSDAIASYDLALKSNPGNVQILLNKGDCLNALADYQNAGAVFNSVLANDPKNKRAMTGLGTSLLNQGKYQDALTAFNNALSIDPNYVDALVGKSRTLLLLTNSNDSLQIVNKAIEIDSTNTAAWTLKGDIYAVQSKYYDARQAYDQALKSNPNSMAALMGKADVLIKMEDYAGAVAMLDTTLTISPNNKDLWNEKGYALMKKGENSNAVIALNKALELDPNFVLAWSNKGYALSGAGNYNQSLQAFERAIVLNPNYKAAWIGKSIVYTQMGDFKASEAAAAQALSIKQ